MTMELRQFRYFLTVAEEGHITRAAERLGIEQPPLSRQIKAMERELAVQLLRRKARGVELTEAGRAFRDRARLVLANVEEACDAARRTARGEQGRINIGVTPTGPLHPFVPRIIRSFREAYPLVSITLDEGLSKDIVEQLQAGVLDAAFAWTPPAEGIVVFPLLDDDLVVALPSRHALAKRRGNSAISLKALAGETFIVYGRKDGFGLFAATISACRSAGFNPRFGPEAPRLASALSLAAAGFGMFFVPSSIQRMRVDGIAFRRLKGPTRPKSTLSLACRRNDPSAAVQRFVQMVKKAAKDFVPE